MEDVPAVTLQLSHIVIIGKDLKTEATGEVFALFDHASCNVSERADCQAFHRIRPICIPFYIGFVEIGTVIAFKTII